MLEEIKAKYKDDAALIRRLESVEKELEELRRDKAISEDLLGIAYKNSISKESKISEWNQQLDAFNIIKKRFVRIGGTRGNPYRGPNEYVITLENLTIKDVEFLKEMFKK